MSLNLPLALQYAIVALVVLLALWIFASKQIPGTLRRLRLGLAAPLVRQGRPPWMRRLARWIAPASAQAGGACGGCDSCGDSRQPPV